MPGTDRFIAAKGQVDARENRRLALPIRRPGRRHKLNNISLALNA